MSALFRLITLCLSFLFFTAALHGYANIHPQSKEISFEHLSVDKGLSSTPVYAVTQTTDGFIWIGTQNGLNRYDGNGFKVFNFVPGGKNTLSNNWVKALCIDKEGNLWIGTNSGLNKYNHKTETFTAFFNDTDRESSLPNNNIWSLYSDREGMLWVGTNNGLSRYNPADGQFINYFITSSTGKISNAINSIAEDQYGNLWIGTWGNGFFLFDKKKATFANFADVFSIPQAANQFVKVLKTDKKGELWIGTLNNGLHRFEPKTGKYTVYKTSSADESSISDNGILSVMEDSRGNIWVGTHAGGFNHFDRFTSTFTRYQKDFLKPQSLQAYWVSSFFEDKTGNIWIGHDNGLSKFYPEGPRFVHYKNNPFDSNSVPASNISVIYEDKEGILWIGTWATGMSRFDRNKNKFTHYPHNSSNPASISDKRVWGICEDEASNLWIVTGGGLDKFDKRTGRLAHFNDLQKNNLSAQIDYKFLSSIAIDKQQRLWIGTWGGGLYRHDLRSNSTVRFMHSEFDYNSLSNDGIKHVFVDSKQNIWISTWEGGLDKLTFDSNGKPVFKHFRYKGPDSKIGIGSDTPQLVFEDSKNRIWVGTQGGGLCLFNPVKGDFEPAYLKEPSSFPKSIFGILEDDHGNLWLSTNNGIVHYNPKSGHARRYDVTDGLQGNTFLSGHCKTKDGAMFFGGHNGINLFSPVRIKESHYKPKILITELWVFNELIEIGKLHKNAYSGSKPILEKPLHLCKEITLSYRDYIVSFNFTSLDFTASHKNKFMYMLENFEDEWHYTDGSKKLATYTNLTPGEYTFKVKGTNSDGNWNESPASLKLIITPPFWQTWWFRTVVGGILLLIAFGINKIWMQLKLDNLLALERAKAEEAEAIRKKVAMDFHDEMGNQLASITALINLINIRQSKKEYFIEDLLTRLNQHAQTLFYGTKDFIWSIDPKSDKIEVILMNIKDFGDDLFDRTGVSFRFYKKLTDPNLTFPSGSSRHITLICKEVFTNIVKHANCQSVCVNAISGNEFLSISIKDDGCGFDMAALKRAGNGLENMRARAKKINAEISIQSIQGQGTEIILHINLPKIKEDKKKLVLELE